MACRLVLAGVLALGVQAQAALADPPDRSNAAWWYREAAHRARGLSPEEWSEIRRYIADPIGAPPASVQEALARAEPALRAAREGAQRKFASYDIDLAKGMHAYYPEAMEAFQLGTLLKADAFSRMMQDPDGAAGATAAMYRMAEHMSQTHFGMHALAARNLFDEAESVTTRAMESGTFNASQAASLLEATRGFDARDPLNLGNAHVNTVEILLDWFDDLHAGGADDKIQGYLTIFERTSEVKLADADDEAFQKSLGQSRAALDLMAEIYSEEDPERAKAELADFQAAVDRGDYGFLLSWFDSAASDVGSIGKYAGTLAARRAQLQRLAGGELQPEDLLNAAVLYLAAIQLIEQRRSLLMPLLEPAKGAQGAPELDPGDDQALEALGKVVEAFRSASEVDRCDFSIARPGVFAFVPTYLPGMHDAIGLLHFDARRLLQQDMVGDAVDRLATCYRMVRHLQLDDHLASSLVAHAAFNGSSGITQVAARHERWSALDGDRLLVLVNRLGPKDPLGYHSSLGKVRAAVPGPLRWAMDGAEKKSRETVERMVAPLNADQFLCLLGLLSLPRGDMDGDKIQPLGAGLDGEKLPPTYEPALRLSGVFSADGLDAVRAALPAWAAEVRRGSLAFLDQPCVAEAAGATEKMRAARHDYRRAIAALEPPSPTPPAPQ